MIMWLGTYESAYPRTRVLVTGLRELGAGVVERHEPLWERDRHKAGSFLRPASLARAAGRYAGSWAKIAPGALGDSTPAAVVAGYPAQPDAPFGSMPASSSTTLAGSASHHRRPR